MPQNNNFQHSKYSRSNPTRRALYQTFLEGEGVGSSGWFAGMGKSIDRMMRSGVRGILFVNGNPYSDLFGSGRLDEVGGLKRGYSRGIPGIESLLSLLRPATNGLVNSNDDVPRPLFNTPECSQKLDKVVHEVGNFSAEYVKTFQEAAKKIAERPIPINRYLWSNLNHHFGRVKSALDLLEFLEGLTRELSLRPKERLLLQAHGHAGQILGILSNLVSPEESSNRQILFQVLSSPS